MAAAQAAAPRLRTGGSITLAAGTALPRRWWSVVISGIGLVATMTPGVDSGSGPSTDQCRSGTSLRHVARIVMDPRECSAYQP